MAEPVTLAGLALLVGLPVTPVLPAGAGEVVAGALLVGGALVVGTGLLLETGALLDGRGALVVGRGALVVGVALLDVGAALLLTGALELGLDELVPAAELGTEPIGATEVDDFDGLVDTGCLLVPLDTDCPGSTDGFLSDGPCISSRPPAATAATRAAPATRAPISGPRERRSS